MRWKSKHTETIPKPGDYRVSYVFAWLPKCLNGVTVWLERYKRIEEYNFRERLVPNYRGGFYKHSCWGWEVVQERPISKTRNVDRCEHQIENRYGFKPTGISKFQSAEGF